MRDSRNAISIESIRPIGLVIIDEIINLKSDAFSITEADSDVPSFKKTSPTQQTIFQQHCEISQLGGVDKILTFLQKIWPSTLWKYHDL